MKNPRSDDNEYLNSSDTRSSIIRVSWLIWWRDLHIHHVSILLQISEGEKFIYRAVHLETKQNHLNCEVQATFKFHLRSKSCFLMQDSVLCQFTRSVKHTSTRLLKRYCSGIPYRLLFGTRQGGWYDAIYRVIYMLYDDIYRVRCEALSSSSTMLSALIFSFLSCHQT